LKQPGLAELAREIEAGIIIGKDMGAVLAAHPVEGFTAPLRDNNGAGLADSAPILIIRQPTSTKDVPVGHYIRMK
jgi:hypothetical protein